jgi:hypothetical protein
MRVDGGNSELFGEIRRLLEPLDALAAIGGGNQAASFRPAIKIVNVLPRAGGVDGRRFNVVFLERGGQALAHTI